MPVNSSEKPLAEAVVPEVVVFQKSAIPIDSLSIIAFFNAYPNLKKYEGEVMKLYQKHNFTQVWHDSEGTIEFAHSLFVKAMNLEAEGVNTNFLMMKRSQQFLMNIKKIHCHKLIRI
ncbi:MAG: hypothetical protein U5K51_02740 [Flavobacteriaceae bacterium]|nr:hypothetical protein [Flavobacteriaceae bacterium]